MAELKFEITKNIGILSKGAKGWNKELNLISWNDRDPKYIRKWSPELDKMGKGVTLSMEETVALWDLRIGVVIMTENELGKILKEMYDNAPQGYKVANIHLFGVKYASIILKSNCKAIDIIRASGLKQSYVTEVSNGIKLSEYVMPKL